MAKTKRKINDASTKTILKRLWKLVVYKYKWHLMLALYFMVLSAAGEAFTIKMFQPIIDKVFVAQDAEMLIPIGVSVLFIFFIKGVALYGQSGLMSFIGLKIIADLQKILFDKISHMDYAFFKSNNTGSLVSRFNVDTVMMRNIVSTTLTSIGKDFLEVVFLVILMFYQDPVLASIVLFAFPIGFYPVIHLGRKMRKVTGKTQHEMGSLTSTLEQSFQSINVVKSYNTEEVEYNKVSDSVDKIFRHSYRGARNRAIARPLMEFFGGFAIVVVIIYGGHAAMAGKTSPGSFFAFIGALITAYKPMKSLAKLNVSLQEGLAGAERFFQIIDIEPSIKDKENAKKLNNKINNIKIENMGFSYKTNDCVFNLDNINIEAKSGKTIALVGPSGSGKSTILNLIPRFYDVNSGSIKINDIDIRDLTQKSLRDNISLVSQDIALFDTSVIENIRYGSENATEEEIYAAAKAAAAHDFILELDDGYKTIVGERGSNLSGGQKQRIAIARAMLKNAPILLLDEATSALDTESERHVQKALETLMQGRTSIVIAHRLSTIINSDKIYVVDSGKIVESGTHEELLKNDGIYANLHKMQFNKEDA
jgi:subfamily B ATP-binding cassette protein MsbA